LKLLRDTPETVVRHISGPFVRHGSESFVRHIPEAVARHTSDTQLSSQFENSAVASIDLPDSQEHLLRVCTSVPLLLNECCLVLPANSGHYAFQST